MITIKEFMEIVDYKITEGSEYCWQCYGPNAYRLDSWNQEQEGYTVSIVFDTRTHLIYEANAYDYKQNRAYRLINPDYKFAHDDEASNRDVDVNQAWDDVNYVDLETDDDFIQKAQSIVAGQDYDARVEVPVELNEDTLFGLMTMAHEQDITLNQLVENIVRAEINRLEDQRIESELDEIRRDMGLDVDVKPKKIKKKNKKN
jgi:hypothetical protein